MIKVIDIDEIKHVGINRRQIGRVILTKEYRDYKKVLHMMTHGSKEARELKPPYIVNIYIETYHDIDASIKPILDALNKVITDDRDVEELHVYKMPSKRGRPGRITAEIGEKKCWEK